MYCAELVICLAVTSVESSVHRRRVPGCGALMITDALRAAGGHRRVRLLPRGRHVTPHREQQSRRAAVNAAVVADSDRKSVYSRGSGAVVLCVVGSK